MGMSKPGTSVLPAPMCWERGVGCELVCSYHMSLAVLSCLTWAAVRTFCVISVGTGIPALLIRAPNSLRRQGLVDCSGALLVHLYSKFKL